MELADTVKNSVKTTLCQPSSWHLTFRPVRWESVCGGQQLTFDLSVWETMTAAANMSLLHQGTD